MDTSAQIHHYLTTAPTSGFVRQEVRVVAEWQGRDNLLWRVESKSEEAVLKLYLDAGQARSRRQFDGQQLFARLGLAPQPLWVDRYPEGLARQVLVYRWAPGADVDAQDPDQLAALAWAVAQVHGAAPDDVSRFCPNPMNLDFRWRIVQSSINRIAGWLAAGKGRQMRDLFARLAGRAGELATAALPLWQGVPPTPVHGDLSPENAVIHRGAIVLLDWELFGLGDPALDAAHFLHASRLALGETGQSAWLESYLAGFEQPGLSLRIGAYRRILPFEDVCTLLNGLRELDVGPEKLEEPEETLHFLRQTLYAALAQAAGALAVDLPDPEPALRQLFAPFTIRFVP